MTLKNNRLLSTKQLFLIILPVIIYWSALMFNLGHTWDETYFVISSQNHYDFFEDVLKEIKSGGLNFANKNYYQKYFSYIPEHPSFFNVFGGFILYLTKKAGIQSDYMLQIFRLSNFILLAALIFYCKKISGFLYENSIFPFIAIICLLFFNPRFMTFSAMATSDFCMTVFSVGAAYYYLSNANNLKSKIFLSAAFCGVSGVSKISGFFIIPVIFLHLLLFNRKYFFKYLLIYLACIPIITYMFYPVLWPDIIQGIKFLNVFFLKHYQNYVMYFGKVYSPDTGPAPFHYPLFYFFFGNPEPFVLLLCASIVYIKKYFSKEHCFFFIYIFILFFMLMKPGSPSYDEIKLYLPAVPFMCFLCVKPFMRFLDYLPAFKYKFAVFIFFVFLSIFPALNNLKYPTLYYNLLSPSIQTLDKIGFDIDVRGELFSLDIIKFLNNSDKNDIAVRIAGQEPEIFYVYSRYFKILNKNIKCFLFQENFDCLILLNHKSLFQDVDYFYLKNAKPEISVKYKGIQIYSVYKKSNCKK